jgi:hypothetical protein
MKPSNSFIQSVLTRNISRQIRNNFASRNLSLKGENCLKHLPFSSSDLINHLSSHFEPWMNWNNYGRYQKNYWNDDDPKTWKWNVDHIIPHSTFKYQSIKSKRFKDCWSLNNLRPYSAKLNTLEGNRRND